MGEQGENTIYYWLEQNASGRYEVSSGNVLTIGTESAAWNHGHPEMVDTNSASEMSEDFGSYSSFKLRISGAHIVAKPQETDQDLETWYRMKPAIPTPKPRVRRDKNKQNLKP